MEKYIPSPILDSECFAKYSVTESLPPEDFNEIVTFFSDKVPDSGVAKHLNFRSDGLVIPGGSISGVCRNAFQMNAAHPCDDQLDAILLNANNSKILNSVIQIIPEIYCCFEAYDNLSFNINIKNIAKITAKDEKEWHNQRQFRITGSRCYSIYTYALNDWAKTSAKYFWPKKFSSRYTDHGIQHENAARTAYEETIAGIVFVPGFIVSEKHPWLGFSADGIIMEEGKPTKLLEIKCPFSGKY